MERNSAQTASDEERVIEDIKSDTATRGTLNAGTDTAASTTDRCTCNYLDKVKGLLSWLRHVRKR